jgi:hypothetical protein
VLCNNEVWHRCEFLKPDHFADALHGRMYDAIGKLIAKGTIADPLTLKRQFDQDGALQEVGGAKYLVDLAQSRADGPHLRSAKAGWNRRARLRQPFQDQPPGEVDIHVFVEVQIDRRKPEARD